VSRRSVNQESKTGFARGGRLLRDGGRADAACQTWAARRMAHPGLIRREVKAGWKKLLTNYA
jgi:hypothetical protein